MRLRTSLSAVAGAALLCTSTTVLVAPTANAACEEYQYYALSSSNIRMPFAGVPTFKNGPGGSLTVTKSYSGSVAYQVTAGAEAEVSGVFAKAKVSVSASIAKTNETSATNSYTHKITAGKYGHAQYVSWGKKINWTKKRMQRNCATVTVSSGSINFPSTEEGWRYWETSS